MDTAGIEAIRNCGTTSIGQPGDVGPGAKGCAQMGGVRLSLW